MWDGGGGGLWRGVNCVILLWSTSLSVPLHGAVVCVVCGVCVGPWLACVVVSDEHTHTHTPSVVSLQTEAQK